VRKPLTLGVVAAALLALSVPARAADPALVADALKDFQNAGDAWDERAVFMAVLARPAESAEFDADARAALGDPALRKLLIAKWRGKAAALAETESRRPDVDLSKTYRNWSEIMTPEQRAYTEQRMLSMSAENRDKLIYYLKTLNEKLAANGGKIDDGFFSIAKRIVSGVMEQYRKDLANYVATPLAQQGLRDESAASASLAQELARRAAPVVAAAPPSHVVASEPAASPRPATRPAAPPARPATPPALPPSAIANGQAQPVPGAKPNPQDAPPAPGQTTASNALGQAQAAERLGPAGGAVIDGSTARADAPGTVTVAPGQTAAPGGGLSPATGPSPTVTAAVPPVPGGGADFMSRIEGMGSGRKPSMPIVKYAGAGLGALIGGLLGFLLGGPIGALIGAAVLGAAGYFGSEKLLQKFT